MADRFYGVNKGQVDKDVVDATSSPTKDVEVVVDLVTVAGQGQGKLVVIDALQKIIRYILKQPWPPA